MDLEFIYLLMVVAAFSIFICIFLWLQMSDENYRRRQKEVKQFTLGKPCTSCETHGSKTIELDYLINGVVRKSYENLVSFGISPTRAAKSALVVLNIHQPGLCFCNQDKVLNWLLFPKNV